MEHCHSFSQAVDPTASCIALVGNPNVGKSILFHRLTGHYVIVSNYPGTTVEVAHGQAKRIPSVTIVDTPGINAFPPLTEDEAVTARLLLKDNLKAVVQVGDAKNLQRTIYLTIQLAEMGIPLLLALNMMDEAHKAGLQVDVSQLSKLLGVSVIPTVAVRNQGVESLEQAVGGAILPNLQLTYPDLIEDAVRSIEPALPKSNISRRSLALLFLSGDPEAESWLKTHMDDLSYQGIEALRQGTRDGVTIPLSDLIRRTREQFIASVISRVGSTKSVEKFSSAQKLGRLAMHPFWGLPLLGLVLYGMYWFVGVFGAGTLVGLLEEQLFGEWINPWLSNVVSSLLPVPFLAEMLVGEYGLWTMGITYAVALLLPIVATFFITFGILEDSGYLPRLAALSNRMFQSIGLNGKAVLPMVLGLGCVTMATMTTRILASKRDRLLVILLLALAVPCSAQLGVILGMLAGISGLAALVWAGIVLAVLLAVGWIAARLMPGNRDPLLVEIPPMRWPVFSNVLIKMLARLEWYIKEAVPLFLLGTFLLFVLDQLQVLPWIIEAGKPLVSGWLGLPEDASKAFLMGFMRRDFAATGLFAMQSDGLLTPHQVLVSGVTITLFVPCIASVFMIAKERGLKTMLAVAGFILPFAFIVGGLLHRGLELVGW